MCSSDLKKIEKLERKAADEKALFDIDMSGKFTPESVEKIKERFKDRPRDLMTWAEARKDRKELSQLENYLKNGGAPAEVKGTWARSYLQSMSKEERKKTLDRWKANKVLAAKLLDELYKEKLP